jgi:hypothetical protein
MSIDTYDTLAIIRPGAEARYSLDWIEHLTREVAIGATISRQRNHIGVAMLVVARQGVELHIYLNARPAVVDESNEIAEEDGLDCAGAKCRFELFGTDVDLVLMNDHLLLCERLNATGDFVLYSGQAGPYDTWT